MSRFANFVRGIASPFVDTEGDPPSESEKRERTRRRRRERYNSPDTSDKAERGKTARKQEDGPVDRLVSVNESVRDNIRGNARSKPYDPVFLRDISANAVVQAYIDTLSQDVASTEWAVVPRDEDADISDEALAKVERRLKQLPPGTDTFADLLEATTRVLLELGDSCVVKHYYEDEPGRLAELVPVDSASLFKIVDKHGIPEGYVQISKRGGDKKHEFAVDDVIWAEWSNRPDRFYGQGPLEKAQNEVELIEELAEKERLDLIQGGPPGVLSPEALDEYGGLPNDEDWETFVEGMRLDAGERHRVGYSKVPVNFEPVSHNYQELQILDRSKYWVTVIGSVFKVNPSYAGFDFENTNRATDETQQQAYAQRGFRVTLRQLEEAFNRGLIWSDISDDVKLEFTQEQTVEERRERASLIESQASAGMDMAEAGRTVTYRDGRLTIEDGEIEEGSDDSGGLFGSIDTGEDPDVDDVKRARAKSVGKDVADLKPADFRFENPNEAFRAADLLGIDGIHRHTRQDGEPYFMPGDDHSRLDAILNADESASAKEVPQSVVDTIGEDRFVPPEGAASNAQEALDLIDEHGRDVASGGTEEALARARQIIDHAESGDPLVGTNDDGVPYVEEIANFFARHRAQGNHEFDAAEHDAKYEDPGWLADMLWGGDAGQSWSSSLADAIDDAEEADTGGDGGLTVTPAERAAKTDEVLLRAYKRQIMPPSLDAIEKDAWTSDEDVPEYIVDAIEEQFDAGAIFDQFASIPGRVADVISSTLEDALTQPQGWSLDSMVDRMSDELPRADPDDLETIARTESSNVLNNAREDGYRDRGLDDAKFYWQGPGDSRTTQACEDMKIATGQISGSAEAFPSVPGEAVSLSKLVDLEEQAQATHFPNLDFRRHTLHPNERHTFVRATGTGSGDRPDVDVDVDVPGADAFDAEDAPVSPEQLSAKDDHDHDDPERYEDVVDRVAKATNVTRRVGQIEDALGSPLPVVLRECLEDKGSTRSAHKELNRRLAECDDWDETPREEGGDGEVSSATIYEWADRYSGHLSHLT